MNETWSESMLPAELEARFRAVRVLGQGAFGRVIHATDVELNRPVAVKVLRSHQLEDEISVGRFLDEARLAARIQSPHVAKVYEQGKSGAELYLIYELIPGVSLEKEFDAKGPLPLGRCLQIALGIFRGLSAMHEVGVIHRDVKPANILLRPGDHAVLIDLGLAKDAAVKGRTKTGHTAGTPRYLPFEAFRGTFSGPSLDLYSTGLLIHDLLAGPRLFRAPTIVEVYRQKESFRICQLRKFCPEAPERLENLVDLLLSNDPNQRPSSAASVIQELEEIKAEAVQLTGFDPRPDAAPEMATEELPRPPPSAQATQSSIPSPSRDAKVSGLAPSPSRSIEATPISSSAPRSRPSSRLRQGVLAVAWVLVLASLVQLSRRPTQKARPADPWNPQFSGTVDELFRLGPVQDFMRVGLTEERERRESLRRQARVEFQDFWLRPTTRHLLTKLSQDEDPTDLDTLQKLQQLRHLTWPNPDIRRDAPDPLRDPVAQQLFDRLRARSYQTWEIPLQDSYMPDDLARIQEVRDLEAQQLPGRFQCLRTAAELTDVRRRPRYQMQLWLQTPAGELLEHKLKRIESTGLFDSKSFYTAGPAEPPTQVRLDLLPYTSPHLEFFFVVYGWFPHMLLELEFDTSEGLKRIYPDMPDPQEEDIALSRRSGVHLVVTHPELLKARQVTFRGLCLPYPKALAGYAGLGVIYQRIE